MIPDLIPWLKTTLAEAQYMHDLTDTETKAYWKGQIDILIQLLAKLEVE